MVAVAVILVVGLGAFVLRVQRKAGREASAADPMRLRNPVGQPRWERTPRRRWR